jgi:predicted Rossmann fold nucleotide-binding protein DprA/Smf involved in DNA uptake
MAEIGGANVFTNRNSGCGDLLQQAFQQVVDENDQENEFVAFLQNDTGDSQVIQLTAEQAAALGITIKIEDHPSDANTTEFQDCRELEQPQQQGLSQEESQRIINELTQSGLLKHNGDGTCATFDNWTVQQQK